MVSTRQMSIINGGGGGDHDHGAGPSGTSSSSTSTTRTTRHSSSSSALAVYCNRHLLDLPQEIMEKIFEYLTFKNVCQLRPVCHKFDQYCGHFLNTAFLRLQTYMLQRFQDIKGKMPRRESARRNHHLACESDIVETLHMRLTLLQMSFGKHIERKHCCFFPGEILDEVYNILVYIRVTPKLSRPYKVTDELFDLSTMAMEYFKEKIEPDLPEIAYFGPGFLDFTGSVFPAANKDYMVIDSSPLGPEEGKEQLDRPGANDLDCAEEQPQGVMATGIRKIRQGMKRYNHLLTSMKRDLRVCRRKVGDQQKQVVEVQKLVGEQAKTSLECSTRMDEYDKKNDEISRKFSTLLQELNKCKTELQYWRSKSPATPPFCSACGANAAAGGLVQVEAAAVPVDDAETAELGLNVETAALDPLLLPPPPQFESGAGVATPDAVGDGYRQGKRKLEETPSTGKGTGRRKMRSKRAKL